MQSKDRRVFLFISWKPFAFAFVVGRQSHQRFGLRKCCKCFMNIYLDKVAPVTDADKGEDFEMEMSRKNSKIAKA